MSVFEIVLIGAALAMDATAIGMASGMAEPRMRTGKAAVTAGTFALFQFFMPLLGYVCGAVFSAAIGRIAPWLSFALLSFLGGKMIVDCVREGRERRAEGLIRPLLSPRPAKNAAAWAGRLLVQGVATSLDALAVGVTLLAAEVSEGLPAHIAACAAVIGAVTFLLSYAGVQAGRRVGDKFADLAGAAGGIVLVAIGCKLLLETLV